MYPAQCSVIIKQVLGGGVFLIFYGYRTCISCNRKFKIKYRLWCFRSSVNSLLNIGLMWPGRLFRSQLLPLFPLRCDIRGGARCVLTE